MHSFKRLGKNTLLVFIGNAGGKLIGFIMLPVYTRWLSTEEYGTTDIINVYVSFFLGLATCCIAESIFIFPKGQSQQRQSEYFSTGLLFSVVSLLFCGILFFVVTKIFCYLNVVNSFTNNWIWIFLLLCATYFQYYLQQFVRSIDKILIYSVTGIILTASTALFSFLLIPNLGVKGYVLAMIIAHCLAAIYACAFSKSYAFVSITAINKKDCKEMLAYSIPLIPNTIMWWLIGALNRPIIESNCGMQAVGIYAVANKFPTILSTLFNIFSTAFVISVIEEFRKENYKVFFNKIFHLVVILLIIASCIMTILSSFIVKIFASQEFYEAWKYFPILTLGVIFSSISSMSGSNFSASKESKYLLYSSIWGASASILCNFLLIPIWGLLGASISVVISFIVTAFFRILYSWKYVHIQNILVLIISLIIAILFVPVGISEINYSFKVIILMFSVLLLLWINKTSFFEILKFVQNIKQFS